MRRPLTGAKPVCGALLAISAPCLNLESIVPPAGLVRRPPLRRTKVAEIDSLPEQSRMETGLSGAGGRTKQWDADLAAVKHRPHPRPLSSEERGVWKDHLRRHIGGRSGVARGWG